MFDTIRMKLRFGPLMTGHIGALASIKGLGMIMVFPSDSFAPITGESYDCMVSVTGTGRWQEGDKSYRTAHAVPIGIETVAEAGFLEQIQYAPRMAGLGNNPLANLSALRESLPNADDIAELIAIPHPKKKTPMFQPAYLDSDPEAGGEPSMRFFNPDNELELVIGQTYRTKIVSYRDTGRQNTRGSRIVEVTVRVIGSKKRGKTARRAA